MSYRERLAYAGITEEQAALWRKVAAIPEEVVSRYHTHVAETGEEFSHENLFTFAGAEDPEQMWTSSQILSRDGKRGRGPSQATLTLIAFAWQLLDKFHPMNLRQLFYAIFSAAQIEFDNTTRDYKRLSRATTKARRKYRKYELAGYSRELLSAHDLIPPDWIVDELREAEIVSMWGDLGGYLDTVRSSYRRNNWQDQPNYCEVWSEKASVLGSLRPITQEYGVMLRACRGFGSTGMEGQIGNLFENINKPITIFYLGDHDPSGHDIERDIRERTQAASGKEFSVIRLAIHPSDIKAFNLPPQRIKPSDSRAKGFQRRFGTKAPTVELDALPVEELRRRVRTAIRGLIDVERWNQQIAIQEVELDSIARFVDKVKNLPQMGT